MLPVGEVAASSSRATAAQPVRAERGPPQIAKFPTRAHCSSDPEAIEVTMYKHVLGRLEMTEMGDSRTGMPYPDIELGVDACRPLHCSARLSVSA